MSTENKLYTKRIVGYSDEISVRSGGNISFMVSSEDNAEYDASFVRIIHGDTNPEGPGYKVETLSTDIDGSYAGQRQECLGGSFVTVSNTTILNRLESFTVQAMIWPTTPEKGFQSIVSHWNEQEKSGFILGIDSNGAASFRIGDGSGNVQEVSTDAPLIAREWYLIAASFDAKSGEARILQDPKVDYAKCDDRADRSASIFRKKRK